MKKNHIYRSVEVESFDHAALRKELVPGQELVVAIDVARSKFVAAFSDKSCAWLRLVKWEHPRQITEFLAILENVQSLGHPVVVVLEPTGTYGDALRYQLGQRQIEVYRASTKHVHDAAEIYDGVPSKHDAKDAAVLGWLHGQGRTARWLPMSEERRRLRSMVDERDLYDVPLRRAKNKLEAMLARHFPELGRIVDVADRRSIWALLQEFPAPHKMAANADQARVLLRKESRNKLKESVIDRIIGTASTSCGEAMQAGDERYMQRLLREMRRCYDELIVLDRELDELTATPALAPLRELLGAVTLAVVIAYVGLPSEYPSAAAFEKACGLNLRESSSGTHQGKLKITKRGPAIVRKYLCLASLRLIQHEPLVRRWYESRGGYQGDSRMKAVTAVMRKMTKSMIHLRPDNPFDAKKLFDERRLTIPSAQKAA